MGDEEKLPILGSPEWFLTDPETSIEFAAIRDFGISIPNELARSEDFSLKNWLTGKSHKALLDAKTLGDYWVNLIVWEISRIFREGSGDFNSLRSVLVESDTFQRCIKVLKFNCPKLEIDSSIIAERVRENLKTNINSRQWDLASFEEKMREIEELMQFEFENNVKRSWRIAGEEFFFLLILKDEVSSDPIRKNRILQHFSKFVGEWDLGDPRILLDYYSSQIPKEVEEEFETQDLEKINQFLLENNLVLDSKIVNRFRKERSNAREIIHLIKGKKEITQENCFAQLIFKGIRPAELAVSPDEADKKLWSILLNWHPKILRDLD
ncbi:MAG TPA: hypothetical protein EYP30_03010 [Archaeoglobaceae archaeon]|nr:hypothetical protein [Archaeoglobaceae archaeon]